jgi:hypothetical protein
LRAVVETAMVSDTYVITCEHLLEMSRTTKKKAAGIADAVKPDGSGE